jgi:ATP synthase protein I
MPNKNKRDDSVDKFEQDVLDAVSKKSLRKQVAQHNVARNPWFGLGLFGLIGWSVVIPTLAGIWIGLILDKRFSGSISWTLTLLLGGLLLGCFNAAHWVRTENERQTHFKSEEQSDD